MSDKDGGTSASRAKRVTRLSCVMVRGASARVVGLESRLGGGSESEQGQGLELRRGGSALKSGGPPADGTKYVPSRRRASSSSFQSGGREALVVVQGVLLYTVMCTR